MVQRTGGFRRKTRDKLSKRPREKGKFSIRRALHEYKQGDRVTLAAEPSRQKGMYHPRYHGLAGTIKKKQGNCYQVEVAVGRTKKELIVHPAHLRSQA